METTQPIFNGEQKKKYDDRGISFCVDPSKNLTGWCLGKILTKYSHTSFLLLFVMHPASYKEVSVCSV